MKTLLFLGCLFALGLCSTSCSSHSDYREVRYGGSIYYVDHYGHYYNRHWNGYRPCPIPPGLPERPIKPIHPIEKPPGSIIGKPPHTKPVNRPAAQPMPRPIPRRMPSRRAR